jgi:cytochrome c biogenesis protein CcdA
MLGLDDWIVKLGGNGLTALIVALLLGLRHATDPDHLTAVSALFLSDRRTGPRQAGLLGLAWGLGHAVTVVAFGLPVVLFRQYLPAWLQQAAEAAIGVAIVILAGRLLLRWHRGYFHAHVHTHGPVRHAHAHVHESSARAAGHDAEHTHPHAEGLGRSPLAAFGIGLMHGIGGSAGVGILLVGSTSGATRGAMALVVFAVATAGSMALLSTAFGFALTQGSVQRGLARLVPVLGVASLLFGVWYSFDALGGGT